jgi:hypothetical protein
MMLTTAVIDKRLSGSEEAILSRSRLSLSPLAFWQQRTGPPPGLFNLHVFRAAFLGSGPSRLFRDGIGCLGNRLLRAAPRRTGKISNLIIGPGSSLSRVLLC